MLSTTIYALVRLDNINKSSRFDLQNRIIDVANTDPLIGLVNFKS
jgi:hypothetical protein